MNAKLQQTIFSWFSVLILSISAKQTCWAELDGLAQYEVSSIELARDSDFVTAEENSKLELESEPLIKWKDYLQRYNKHYPSLSEQSFRHQLFLISLAKVVKQWVAYIFQGSTKYFFSLNQFSDLTPEERMRSTRSTEFKPLISNLIENEQVLIRSKRDTVGQLKKKIWINGIYYGIDWREPCLSHEVMNQGDCGSCYIMSSIRMFEWLYCNSTQIKKKFSEQVILDCGKPYGLSGCKYGNLLDLIKFVKDKGLFSADEFPYEAEEQGFCPIDQASAVPPRLVGKIHPFGGEKHRVKVKDVQYKVQRTLEEHERELTNGPKIAFVCIDSDFWDYKGGVYVPGPNETCRLNMTGHYMLLVGMGTDKRAGDFWLFANSVGPKWGESNGYVRIERGTKNHVILYTVKLTSQFD